MSDDFEATFVVDLAPADVWESIARCKLETEADGDEVRYVLPGWPSFEALPLPGARTTVIEEKPERLLRVKKDHHPCAGTEIVVRLEQAETGTRVTIVQSGFGPFLDIAGRDVVFGHGHQIARDFQIFLERGLVVPGTIWGVPLGARTRQTATGLAIDDVTPEGFAATAGLRVNDLLVTLRGVRIHDTQQLSTVLALTEPGSTADVTWARGRELMASKATF